MAGDVKDGLWDARVRDGMRLDLASLSTGVEPVDLRQEHRRTKVAHLNFGYTFA